jgi:hypothetical protein
MGQHRLLWNRRSGAAQAAPEQNSNKICCRTDTARGSTSYFILEELCTGAAQAAAEQIHLGAAQAAVEQTLQETAQTDTPGQRRVLLNKFFHVAQAL